ncbi:hypothetical protein CVT25_013077 [Psilocybe cyanescens]|uniref:Uncharacterized protein n=1 Tax=Psilocybe cyanescens TaxID=93625 RepID=A0A409XWP1_PSICY|nr:hypothetical protein CVT25_013077 [Psilocybe cyanescens]
MARLDCANSSYDNSNPQVILQMRIYALYLLNKKVLTVIGVCFLICSVVEAWIVWTSTTTRGLITISFWLGLLCIKVQAMVIPGGTFCVPPAVSSRRFGLFWIPALVYESFLCLMALFVAVREHKEASVALHRGPSLMDIMIRDSVFYFVV